MAAEIDNFILKFKNLLLAGKNATLVIHSNNGEAEVSLKVVLDKFPPPHVHHGGQQRDGPSRQRRRERRRVRREAEEASKVGTGEQPDHDTRLEGVEAFQVAAVKADQEIEDLEHQVEILRNKNIKAAEEADEKDKINLKEEEELRNTIAVQDMIYESLKERMNFKYGSNFDDDESSNEESESEIIVNQCRVCDFVGKTEGGLKIHEKRKHREKLTSL